MFWNILPVTNEPRWEIKGYGTLWHLYKFYLYICSGLVFFRDCSSGIDEYVQLGYNASTLIIDAVGSGQVSIFDPQSKLHFSSFFFRRN